MTLPGQHVETVVLERLMAALLLSCEMMGVEAHAELVGRVPDVEASKKTVSDTLRQAMEDDPRSLNKISTETGIPRSTLYDLRSGKGISVHNVDRLAEAFDLHLGRRQGTIADEAESVSDG